MSTTTETNNTAIPDENAVGRPTRGAAWRYSEGKIVRGRSEDGTLVKREKIVGRLRRISVHWGTNDSGLPYGQLEADIETAKEGIVRLKAGVTDRAGQLKPGVSAITFAQGLLELAKDELMMACAALARKPNRYGNFSTYANLYHVNENLVPRETRRPERSEKSIMDQWDDLEAAIKTHPAYQDRKSTDDDDAGDSAYSELNQLMLARGWPSPVTDPVDWLIVVGKLFGHPTKTSVTDYSEAEWRQVLDAVTPLKVLPKLLAAAKARAQSQPATNTPRHAPTVNAGALAGDDESDPFVDESDPFAGE